MALLGILEDVLVGLVRLISVRADRRVRGNQRVAVRLLAPKSGR